MRKTMMTMQEIHAQVEAARNRRDRAQLAVEQGRESNVGSVAMLVLAEEAEKAQKALNETLNRQMIPAFNTEGMR